MIGYVMSRRSGLSSGGCRKGMVKEGLYIRFNLLNNNFRTFANLCPKVFNSCVMNPRTIFNILNFNNEKQAIIPTSWFKF